MVVHPNTSSNFKTRTVKIKTLSKEHSEKQQNSSETNNKLIAGRSLQRYLKLLRPNPDLQAVV
jgi:hypothetical protein